MQRNGQQHSASAADNRQDKALGQHLAKQPRRATPERGAKRQAPVGGRWREPAAEFATFTQAISSTRRNSAQSTEQRRPDRFDRSAPGSERARRIVRIQARRFLFRAGP